MATKCPPCLLTDDIIDDLPDDSPIDALEMLEEHGIVGESVETTREAQELLRQHLRDMRDNVFCCKDCDLIGEDLNNFSLEKAEQLLKKHRIAPKVHSLSEARSLLECHLQTKNELQEEELLAIYGPEQVATVVQDLVEQNRNGRVKLLLKLGQVREYIHQLPAKRMADIRRQLPRLDEDMTFVEKQLQRDNFTIMVAGETGSGKSCLLNLLLGELGSELLSVNNLPSTSVITEIKYGDQPALKAHQSGQTRSKRPHCQPLERETAPEEIAKFTHEKGERKFFKYNRVEVIWPCEWIKNGITITDTPGVGENAELTQMVKDYIPKAYGFIYVINTPNAGGINPEELEDLLFYHITKEGIESDGELAVGEHASHVKFNPRSAIFVCNKWDLVKPEEREEVKRYVNMKLKKVWRDFDFDQQVFFLSAEKTKEELKTGHVSKEYRRLLRGVQHLLPAGFKTKLEKQFWSMFHIMERCTWVLKNFILCGRDSDAKQRKQLQYKQARVRLADLEFRPEIAREQMKAMLDEEVAFTVSQIRKHLESPEVQNRLKDWKETECPDVDNLERLQNLQNSLAQQRIRRAVTQFEEEKGLFNGIQKRLLEKFQSVFLSVDSELASIENAMRNEEDLSSLLHVFNQGVDLEENLSSMPHQKQIAAEESSTAWVSLGMVIKLLVLPASAFNAMQKNKKDRKELAAYKKDKPQEMGRITGQVLEDFLNSGKLEEVIAMKLEVLRSNFNKLFDRIPELVKANQKLLSQLETDLSDEQDFHEYIDVYNKGVRLQDSMNFLYMTEVRTYEIDSTELTDRRYVSEGTFAEVKRAKYHKAGKVQDVALKRLKRSLDDETATEFMTEEMNLRRVQGPHIVKFLGTSFKRKGDNFYPMFVHEYCPQSFSDLIHNPEKYQAPGSVADDNPLRAQLMHRAAQYGDEISRSLMAMHGMGFVHRDLKPENLLVSSKEGKDTVKLCDLGISKREADILLSRAGTPLYMAPEVFGSKHYNRSADIFSLGLICWEIWYGCPVAKISPDDSYKLFKCNPFRQNVPPLEWQKLIERCWDSNPARRPTALDCSQLFSTYYLQDGSSTDFAEIKQILSEVSAPSDDESEEVASPTPAPEMGESELYWIEGVGMDTIVDKFKMGEEISEQMVEEETACLTDNQTQAVVKRVLVLNKTLRQMRAMSASGKGGRVARESQTPFPDRPNGGDEEDEEKTLTASSLLPASDGTVETPTAHSALPPRDLRRSVRMTNYLPRTLVVMSTGPDASDPLGLNTFPQTQNQKNALPNFSLTSDVLGVTRVCDLSETDLEKVSRLALLELTALYDSYELSYQPLKKKKKGVKEKGVFGVPLQVLYKSDLKKDPSLKLPLFYKELVEHIEQCGVEEEGILRVSGSKARVKQLRSDIDHKFRSGKFSWEEVAIHEATGLFKQLVRELPIPLMTLEYFKAFTLIETIPDYTRKLQLQALNLLVLMLPSVHRNTLELILQLLQKIVANEENKMTMYNVSMVMCPNLFPAPPGRTPEFDLLFMAKMTNITQMLIKYLDILWTVPSFLVSQLRHQNELLQLKKQKQEQDVSFFKKLFQKNKPKLTTTTSTEAQGDLSEVIFIIETCVKSVDSKSVTLRPSTKVKDVISLFSQEEQKEIANSAGTSSSATVCLYEVGGNIGERCLHPDTAIMGVYQVNPKAQWLLKPGMN